MRRNRLTMNFSWEVDNELDPISLTMMGKKMPATSDIVFTRALNQKQYFLLPHPILLRIAPSIKELAIRNIRAPRGNPMNKKRIPPISIIGDSIYHLAKD